MQMIGSAGRFPTFQQSALASADSSTDSSRSRSRGERFATQSVAMTAALMSAACVVLTIAFGAVGSATAADRKPNILLIVGDDMGYADVGFHGGKEIPTPHLDGLAASGVRFTSGYVSGPYCSPTRAGLLTGRYQTRFGHEFNPGGANTGLPLTEQTIADRLRAVGYRTALIGKWHLGSAPEMQPQKRGFDEFFGFLGGAHSYFDKGGVLRGTEPVKDLDYTTDAFAREASTFIEKNREQPWLLYLAFNAVHTPMDATKERLAKFENIPDKTRRTHNAMLLAMDEAIGSVLSKLRATGQLDNTLVTFISDNGGPTMPGTTVNGSRNAPLRGSKRTTLEGGVRVPFLVSWPARIKPGVFDRPVIQLDLHATALAAAGVEARPDWKLDGVDLLPYLSGDKKEPPHDSLYWRFGQQMAIRKGDWKLVRYDLAAETPAGESPLRGVSAQKLYNLADDIGESRDQAAAQPDKVRELEAAWKAWDKDNAPPLWGGNAGAAAGEGNAKKKAKGKAKT